MSDTFNVTATWSKPAYVAGETITGTISGDNTHTEPGTTQQHTVGPVSVPIVAAGGAKSTVSLPPVTVTVTTGDTVTSEPVLIDTALFVASQGGRTWQVSADRKSITAVA